MPDLGSNTFPGVGVKRKTNQRRQFFHERLLFIQHINLKGVQVVLRYNVSVFSLHQKIVYKTFDRPALKWEWVGERIDFND